MTGYLKTDSLLSKMMNIFAGGGEAGLFEAFISPNVDRRAFLEGMLRARGIPFSAVLIAGRPHIIVRFAGDAYNPLFRMKIVVAHYDRSEDDAHSSFSPGANDNSASCFQLVSLAERLLNKRDHNVIIIFSAGEEDGKKGVRFQGSYALATGLKRLRDFNLAEGDVFVFDGCGRGDTLVLSSSGMSAINPAKGEEAAPSRLNARQRALLKRRQELCERTAALARKCCPASWVTLPTPYSDNAGFVAAGIPAQLVTVLPREEAETLLKETAQFGHEALLRELASFKVAESKRHAAAIPQTWKDMHTERDSASSLTPEAFALMERFLDALARDSELRL